MQLSISQLIKDFKNLKSLETNSANYYTRKLLPIMSDEADKKTVKGIILDEHRHENMVQGIIDILGKELRGDV